MHDDVTILSPNEWCSDENNSKHGPFNKLTFLSGNNSKHQKMNEIMRSKIY